MKTNKINALEAVIAALEISENELTNWFNNRGKDKTGLIPTELPLVYRRGNELTVENGLNLSRKSELWGIQLLSGVMVALTCGSGNNVSDTTWGKVKKFAEKMTPLQKRYEGVNLEKTDRQHKKVVWILLGM